MMRASESSNCLKMASAALMSVITFIGTVRSATLAIPPSAMSVRMTSEIDLITSFVSVIKANRFHL